MSVESWGANMKIKQFCNVCNGLGHLDRYGAVTCLACKDTGYAEVEARTPHEATMYAFLEQISENPLDEVTHRVFADWLEENGYDDEALIQREWTAEKYRTALSEVDAFAKSISGKYIFDGHDADEFDNEFIHHEITVDILMRTAYAALKSGDRFPSTLCLPFEIPDDYNPNWEVFWQHFMILTGVPVPTKNRGDAFIRCAC